MSSIARRLFAVLAVVLCAVEPLPMIESEHDNLTPDKGRDCPERQNEILGQIVGGGTFMPKTPGRP